MKGNKLFESSLKLAEQFAKDTKKVPDLFDSLLSEMLPNVSDDEKIKLQKLVKESNKIMSDAKKSGDFAKIKQSIDKLTNDYVRNGNT